MGVCFTFSGLEDDLEDPYSNLAHGENTNVPHSLEQEDRNGRNKATAGDEEAAAPHTKAVVKKKRGRPPSASTKRGRVGGTQVRWTRPRLGRKPPKISVNKSDEDSSASDAMDEEDSRSSKDMGNEGTVIKATTEPSKGKAMEEVELSVGGGSIGEGEEDAAATREMHNEDHKGVVLDRDHGERGEEKIIPKLEITTDPVQAMLLDMIPTLGISKVESTSQVTEEEKTGPGPSNEPKKGVNEPLDQEKVGPGPKKKKVSYKDIASQLLKDL